MAEAPEAFIEWLNEELRKRNWSQNELARESGFTSTIISRVMNGQRPGLEVCKKLAETFDTDLILVLERAGHISMPSTVSWKARFAVSKIIRLPDTDLEQIIQIMDLRIRAKTAR